MYNSRLGKQQHHYYISVNTCTVLTEAETTVYCFSFLLTSNFPALQTLYISASNRNDTDSIWFIISTVTREAGLKEKKKPTVKISSKYSYNFYNDICPKCPFVWKMLKLFHLKKSIVLREVLELNIKHFDAD